MDTDPREPPDPALVQKHETIIACEGYWTHTTNGSDFECGYDPGFPCEECLVTGGKKDPRAKKYIDFEDGR